MKHRRSVLVAAPGVALFAAATLGACGSEPDPTRQAVCVERDAQGIERRADESKHADDCEDGGSHGGYVYSHVFYGHGRTVPPVGGNLRSYGGYERVLPKGTTAAWGAPPRAGEKVSASTIKTSVSRGGFGSTSAKAKVSVGG